MIFNTDAAELRMQFIFYSYLLIKKIMSILVQKNCLSYPNSEFIKRIYKANSMHTTIVELITIYPYYIL